MANCNYSSYLSFSIFVWFFLNCQCLSVIFRSLSFVAGSNKAPVSCVFLRIVCVHTALFMLNSSFFVCVKCVCAFPPRFKLEICLFFLLYTDFYFDSIYMLGVIQFKKFCRVCQVLKGEFCYSCSGNLVVTACWVKIKFCVCSTMVVSQLSV